MGKRRKARECSLQILFQLDFMDGDFQQIQDQYWSRRKLSKEIQEYSRWLISGILSHKEEIDALIESVSQHWSLSRMTAVDRNILRMAVFELVYEKSVVPAVVINEAIEIAKKYSTYEAADFVNGILDAVRKKRNKSKKEMKGKKHG